MQCVGAVARGAAASGRDARRGTGPPSRTTGEGCPRRALPSPLLLLVLLLGLACPVAGVRAEEDAGVDLLAAAQALEAAGRSAEAADGYLAVLAAHPESREAAQGLARAAIATEDDPRLASAEAALGRLLGPDADAGGADAAGLDLHRALGLVLLARSRAATSPGLAAATAHRARAHLSLVVAARADDLEAARHLAQAYARSGDPAGAVGVLDAALTRRTPPPPALLVEKGKVLYEQARALHREAGGGWPLPAEAASLFGRARGTLRAAVTAAPESFDGWLHLAWAAQMLGDREDALEGYTRALVLDAASPLPLRGVLALFADDPARLDRVLAALADAGAAQRQVLVAQAWDRLRRGEVSEARRLVDACLAGHPGDADALFLAGRLHDRAGEESEAVRLYRAALEADGGHLLAAEEIDRRLRARLAAAKADLGTCHDVQAAYEDLAALAPRNPYVRNNEAFLLREAWAAHASDPAWREVLDLAVLAYEDAAARVGPWSTDAEKDVPWERRYALAQIVCDAGVILHTFEPVRDLVRAERHYLEALRWSAWGYLDAWTYLAQVYEQQERWPELHRLALRCAEGLADEQGRPLEGPRAAARARAERLVAEGRVR